jgi:hypothetical protein
VKKSNYCTNFPFGRILNWHGHFKHTLRAQRCRDCGRWTVPCHTVPISHGSTAISGEKKSLAFLLDLYLYFPVIPRVSLWSLSSLVFSSWTTATYDLIALFSSCLYLISFLHKIIPDLSFTPDPILGWPEVRLLSVLP